MPNQSMTVNFDYRSTHSTPIKVRYCEIDGQGRVHNSQYLNYFERGRVEMLRSFGISYKELESTGLMLVIRSMHVDFHSPAEFDEDLTLYTSLSHCFGARIHHVYRLCRQVEPGGRLPELVVAAHSSIACVDREGRVRRLPKFLQLFKGEDSADRADASN